MNELILRNAKLVDGSVADVVIEGNHIKMVGQISGEPVSGQQIDLAQRYYLSPGWIDTHVHCYPNSPIYHDEPDKVGVAGGVTTVVDAGSTGANDIDQFYALTRSVKTQVLALLNISCCGLVTQHELADMKQIDTVRAAQAISAYSDFIVGIKARMSSSVVGDNGLKPLHCAKTIQQENGLLPLMVHIGNNPPDIDDIANLLSSGDIITHCYNGKPNRILTQSGELRDSVRRAIARGVLLDVGYGSASFSLAIAQQAIALGIMPNTISSDIYCRNRINGPVYGLATVMSTFLHLGMSLSQVINCVTLNAANALRLKRKGQLKPGFDADLTLFELRNEPQTFTDAEGKTYNGNTRIVPLAAVVAGELLLTDEGKSAHVFDL